MKFTLNKRLLLVSSWAPPMAGGPQNLYNLFSQFPPTSYCILTSYRTVFGENASGQWLEGRYFFFDYPTKSVEAEPRQRPHVNTVCVSGEPHLTTERPRIFLEKIISLARRILELSPRFVADMVAAFQCALTIVRFTRTGVRIVRKTNVRLVVGISDTGPALIAAYLIARFTGIRFAIYLFDIYLGNNLQPLNRFLARIFEPYLFQKASLVILTNQGTEEFYRRRYGRRFKCAVIQNSIFSEPYESKRTAYAPVKPYVVLFTGHIYWAQERSLMNLIEAVDDLQHLRVELHIYAPTVSDRLKRLVAGHQNIRLDSAGQEKMPAIQCKATILFLPLSWDTGFPSIIATATPGKLIDYLAAGRPILIHAPRYAYVNRYAKENGFALVVEEENVEKLEDGIRTLLYNVDYSRRLIQNALTTLRKNHEATLNAKKLADMINSLPD